MSWRQLFPTLPIIHDYGIDVRSHLRQISAELGCFVPLKAESASRGLIRSTSLLVPFWEFLKIFLQKPVTRLRFTAFVYVARM